jgi:adenosylcobinamide-phosphate synthase
VITVDHIWLLALALAVDAIAGDPDFLWSRVPHPVAVIGWLIERLDSLFNRQHMSAGRRRAFGALTLAIVITVAAVAGYLLERAFIALPYGEVGTVLVAAVLFGARSLYDHVAAVAAAFPQGIEAARAAVAKIVGRDTGNLDEPRVCRAAIESVAENFSDAVVAPAIWFLLLGLPGLFAYKAINTADSMIGHLTPRHLDFGRAAARLDDLVNLPASRLAGALMALAAPLAGGSVAVAFRVMTTDAPHHRSPNAGWPESAMAAALGLALAGPRRYGDVVVDDPFLNRAARRTATPTDIRRALRVYVGAWAILWLIVAALALAFWS